MMLNTAKKLYQKKKSTYKFIHRLQANQNSFNKINVSCKCEFESSESRVLLGKNKNKNLNLIKQITNNLDVYDIVAKLTTKM